MTPTNFCAKCKAIVTGNAEKITGDRLDLPTITKKAPANKSAPRSTAKAAS